MNTRYENELIQEIRKLNEEIDEDGETFSDIYVTLENKQSDLERLYHKKASGIIIHSRATWMEKGEKCTDFFF